MQNQQPTGHPRDANVAIGLCRGHSLREVVADFGKPVELLAPDENTGASYPNPLARQPPELRAIKRLVDLPRKDHGQVDHIIVEPFRDALAPFGETNHSPKMVCTKRMQKIRIKP